MRMLTFLAHSFAWQPFIQTLTNAPPAEPGQVEEAVIAFIHIEQMDEAERNRAFRHTLKHLKWLANKKQFRNIVLHSFAHLGGENADAVFAQTFLENLAERLQKTGYHIDMTPFGYSCSWQLDVYGESLAKVYKKT